MALETRPVSRVWAWLIQITRLILWATTRHDKSYSLCLTTLVVAIPRIEVVGAAGGPCCRARAFQRIRWERA